MVTQNKCNVNVGELIEFLSRRHGQGKFITDEYAVVLEAALKAAVASKAYNARKCNDDLRETYRLEEAEHRADLAFAKLVDKKEVRDGR